MQLAAPPRLVEVRALSDLSERLVARSGSLVFLEVTTANLALVLTFISERAPNGSPYFVALLDGASFNSRAATEHAIDVLREAGACEFASSPRQLVGPLTVARRHAALVSTCEPQPADLPFEAWAWSQLPWQDDLAALGWTAPRRGEHGRSN
jgi:hypothetical protein